MEEKPRKRKKRRKKHYLLRFLVFILVCVGSYQGLSSSFFDISDVEVTSNSYYTVEQIKEKAGVKIGENIFRFSKGTVKKKLLADPYFENVKIMRKLPSTIVIDVKERTERAVIPKGRKFVVVDPKGLVLKVTDNPPKVSLVNGLTVKTAKAGKPLEVEENSMLNDTLVMLTDVEESNIFFKRIDISNVIIKAYIYDQLICEGTPENMSAAIKNGNLESALYEMYSKGIERGIIRVGSDNYCSFNPNVE